MGDLRPEDIDALMGNTPRPVTNGFTAPPVPPPASLTPDTIDTMMSGTVTPEQVQLKPLAPTYDYSQDAWARTQQAFELLAKERAQGYDHIQDSLKGTAVLFGHASYDQVQKERQVKLNAESMMHVQDRAGRYIPWMVELADPVGEALAYLEISTAAGATGAATGTAIGATMGAPLGVGGAAAGAAFGASIGTNAAIWEANMAIDAGSIYLHLRDLGAEHDLARNIAIVSAPVTALTALVNVNLTGAVAREAFKKAFVKHFANKNLINPGLAKFLSNAGVTGVLAASNQTVRLLGQDIAANFDHEIPRPEEWVQQIGQAFVAGAFTGGSINTAIAGVSHGVGKLGAGLRAVYEAIGREAAKALPDLELSVVPPTSPVSKQIVHQVELVLGEEATLPQFAQVGQARKWIEGLIKEFGEDEARKIIEEMTRKTPAQRRVLMGRVVEDVFQDEPPPAQPKATGGRLNEHERMIERQQSQTQPERARARAGEEKLKATADAAEKEAAKLAGFVDVDVWQRVMSNVVNPKNLPTFASKQQAQAWLDALVREHGMKEAQRIVRQLVSHAKGAGSAQSVAFVKQATRSLPVGKIAKTAVRSVAEKAARIAKAEVELHSAEKRLNDPTVTGKAHAVARNDKYNALVTIADTAIAGDTAAQLEHPTTRLKRISNPMVVNMRNFGSTFHPYKARAEQMFQLSKDAEELARNFDLTPARRKYDEMNQLFTKMFSDSMQKALGKKPFEVQKILVKSQKDKVKFDYRQLENKTFEGKQRPSNTTVTWEGSVSEFVDLYLKIHDPDAKNGLVTGNGFSIDKPLSKDMLTMWNQVHSLMKRNPEWQKLADGYSDFYKKRRLPVEAFILKQTGQILHLEDTYGGLIKRSDTANLDLDPTVDHNGTNLASWIAQTFNRNVTGTLKARKPESKLPILQSDALENVLSTNRQIANKIAFTDIAAIHGKLYENGHIQRRIDSVFGKQDILRIQKEHLRDVTYRVPKAEGEFTKFGLKLVRGFYPVALGGDAFQYVKQMWGSFSAIAYSDPMTYVRAQIEYTKNSTIWDARYSRSPEVQARYGGNFRKTVTGISDVMAITEKSHALEDFYSAPVQLGDRASIPRVGLPIYIHAREKLGMNDLDAFNHSLEGIELTTSTFRPEYLSQWSRDPASKVLSAFLTQPILMSSRMISKAQAFANHGFDKSAAGDKARGQFHDAILGAKLGALAYGSTTAAVNIALSGGDDVDDQMASVLNTAILEPAVPVWTDLAHMALTSSENLILNTKQNVWELKRIDQDVLNDTIRMGTTVGEMFVTPEKQVDLVGLMADYTGSIVNVMNPLVKLPSKPFRAAEKALKESEE